MGMSLAEALPKEVARVSEMIGLYDSLPNGGGRPAAVLMRLSVARAMRAIGDGDVVEMIRCYEDLKGFTD